jgi:hypothetical protein
MCRYLQLTFSVKTGLPANIEDENLIDGNPLLPQPLTMRTKMSYQLARLQFARFTYKQIWQVNNKTAVIYSEM